MRQIVKFAFTVTTLLFYQHISSQNEKPKVALVLSGGGAKGIAHIPLLQTLDSLGIVPDVVIGTSMGSIVGALYSMGYTGDSIATISNNTKWSKLFGSKVSIKAVSNEEKSEFKRYLVELEMLSGKPRTIAALINDQNLRFFFNEITYPVHDIRDFDKLPIPYRAVAVDIVNGKEVILDKGFLSFAMRSSMSIPAVFLPMEYEDVLLVDGGVLNNFPTDVAKAWGADIIIGSDVGGGMKSKEDLYSVSALVFQTGMLASNLKNASSRALCDVLIDHTKHLTYSTGDFEKNLEILNEGKIGTIEKMGDLVVLAEKLKTFKQLKPQLPSVKSTILIDTISYKGISDNNMYLFKSRVNLKPNNAYSMPEFKVAANNAFGTNLFDAISFELFEDEDKLGLQIKALEKSSHLFKGALHFDDYRGVGLLVNYTGRNVIGNSSRILFSLDITSDLRYRAQYQRNFGSLRNWWFRSEFYGQSLIQNTFVSGNLADDVKYKYEQFDNQFNKNINAFKSYAGVGLNYEWNTLRPKIDPNISSNVFGIKNYRFKTLDLYVHYNYNSLDDAFYANRGSYLYAKMGTSINNDMGIEFLDDFDLPSISGAVNPFSKFSLNFEKRIPINTKLVGIIGVSAGYTFYSDTDNENNSYTEFGYAANYFLGGNIVRPRKDNFVLPGLKEDELAATQFTMIKLAAQYMPVSKIYITPHLNLASVGFNDFNSYSKDFLSPKGQWEEQLTTSFLTTAGITTSYNSILGPVNFDISLVNNLDKIRLFFGVGFHFNRSN